MELFNNREKQKSIKKESIITLIIVGGFTLLFLIPIFGSMGVLGIPILIYFIFKLRKGYKRLKNTYLSKLEEFPNLRQYKGDKYKETLNVIEELKILYSINEEIIVKVVDSDFIDYTYDKGNNVLILTKGFIYFFKREEKTYILQRSMYREKNNIIDAHEVTQKMQEIQRKYGNKLGKDICYHHLDNLEKTFGVLERLKKIKIKGSSIQSVIMGFDIKHSLPKEKDPEKIKKEFEKSLSQLMGKDIKIEYLKNNKNNPFNKIRYIFMTIIFLTIGSSFLIEFLNK